MIDTTRLTEKQRQVIRLFQERSEISSTILFCKEHELDFNFVKGFLLSGIFEGYLKITNSHKDAFILSSKGKKIGQHIPGYFLAKKLSIENLLDVTRLQEELGQDCYGKDFGALKKEKIIEVKVEENGGIQKLYYTDLAIIDLFIKRQTVNQSWNGWFNRKSSIVNQLMIMLLLSILSFKILR
jgi:hypothetical protein